MKQKGKSKAKQMESESEQSEELAIAKVHDQKQLSSGTSFLVEFKGHPNKSEWLWKSETDLIGFAGFKKEQRKFLAAQQTQPKNKDVSSEKNKIIFESQEKKTLQKPSSNLLEIDKEILKQKLKKAGVQQMLLDKFVVKSQSKQTLDLKKPEVKVESTLQTNLINSNQTFGVSTGAKTSEGQEQKPEPQKNQWIDKIKAIKSIKGFELKNGQMSYEVDVWDRNGQTFFVPPLSSEAVKKIDEIKLGTFLQECLIRGYKEQRNVMEECE